MARQNVKDQKKKKLGVRFYSILSTVICLILITTIIVGVIAYNKSCEGTYVNKFENWTKHKINNDELDDLMDPQKTEFGGYTVIFAYDDSFMDYDAIADLDSSDPNKSVYEKCNLALESLYETIMANNAKFNSSEDLLKRVDFYVINTSLIGNDTILTNSKYGNVESAPSIIVLDSEGNNTKELKHIGSDDAVSITNGKGNYTNLTSDLRTLKDFINNIE